MTAEILISGAEMLDAIDAENKVIGQMTKEQAYKNRISHRVVHVMVLWNDRVFIPRRSLTVRYLPGYFCSSAGGHVSAGETSRQGALRELQEEIGLGGPIQLLSEFFFDHDFPVHTSVFLKIFDPVCDRIILNPEEVLSGAYYTLSEIAQLDSRHFHPQLNVCIEAIRKYL